MATADLLVLALRVPPEKLRESLNAEHDLPVRRKERPDTSGSACENSGDLDRQDCWEGMRAFSWRASKGA